MYLMSEIVGVAWVCRLELERKTCPPNWWSRFLKHSTASLRVEEQSVQMSLVCENESHLPLQAVSINTVKVSQCSYNLLCCPDHLEQASPASRCPASSPDRVFSLSWTWQCSTVSYRQSKWVWVCRQILQASCRSPASIPLLHRLRQTQKSQRLSNEHLVSLQWTNDPVWIIEVRGRWASSGLMHFDTVGTNKNCTNCLVKDADSEWTGPRGEHFLACLWSMKYNNNSPYLFTLIYSRKSWSGLAALEQSLCV